MPTNPPSFRYPFATDPNQAPDEHGWKREVHNALKNAFNGLLDLNQAIPALLAKINAAPTAKASPTAAAPNIGTVNNQAGQAAYQVQQSDYGALVVVNDASGVAVSLNSSVTKPYYSRIKVDSGSGNAILTPTSGTINGAGFILVPAGTTLNVFFNSTDNNWTTG